MTVGAAGKLEWYRFQITLEDVFDPQHCDEKAFDHAGCSRHLHRHNVKPATDFIQWRKGFFRVERPITLYVRFCTSFFLKIWMNGIDPNSGPRLAQTSFRLDHYQDHVSPRWLNIPMFVPLHAYSIESYRIRTCSPQEETTTSSSAIFSRFRQYG